MCSHLHSSPCPSIFDTICYARLWFALLLPNVFHSRRTSRDNSGEHPAFPFPGHGRFAVLASLGLTAVHSISWGTHLPGLIWQIRRWRTCFLGRESRYLLWARWLLSSLPELFDSGAQSALWSFDFPVLKAWSHFHARKAFVRNHPLFLQLLRPDATYYQNRIPIFPAFICKRPAPQFSGPIRLKSHPDWHPG